MNQLLNKIKDNYPLIDFVASDLFYWSPSDSKIFYNKVSMENNDNTGLYALFHELSHAILGHKAYLTDYELLDMEVSAWINAGREAEKYSLTIDSAYMENCLDSYRDWLNKRATCPQCGVKCLQYNSERYRCFNCHTKWAVSPSRFCRPYRYQLKENESLVVY